MSTMKIKKGDTVKVIAGKDANAEGKVLSVDVKNGKVLVEGVNKITKHTKPSQANYFFLEVLPPYTSKQLSAILLEKYNILVSACLAKKGIEVNRYMRIAVRSHSDNARLVKAMRELIK